MECWGWVKELMIILLFHHIYDNIDYTSFNYSFSALCTQVPRSVFPSWIYSLRMCLSLLMSDTIPLVMSMNCVRMTSLELTNGMSIWEDVGGLWPYYFLTVTLCEKFVSIPTEKRHLISAHGASFALVLEMAKSLSHVFISYNELHPGILLNKPASEIALFITLRRCCNCVPSRWLSLFSRWWCFFFSSSMFMSVYFCSQTEAVSCQGKQSKAKAKGETAW